MKDILYEIYVIKRILSQRILYEQELETCLPQKLQNKTKWMKDIIWNNLKFKVGTD